MSYGDRCNNCGKCCKAIPCGIGLALLGDYRPCVALEKYDGEKYHCGLVLHASKYIDLGDNVGWKDEWIGNLFSHMLGVGMGCCTSPEQEIITKALRGRLKKSKRKRMGADDE